jgi:hypothetical protein
LIVALHGKTKGFVIGESGFPQKRQRPVAVCLMYKVNAMALIRTKRARAVLSHIY